MTCATNLTIALSRFHRFENGQKAKPMEGLKCLNKKIIATFSQVVAQITNNTPRNFSLTGLLLGSLFGGVLPLLPDDGQSGEVAPGLLRLPLRVQLLVSLLGLLLLNLFPLAAGQFRLRSSPNLFDLYRERKCLI